MIASNSDLEAQLERLGRSYESADGDVYLVSMGSGHPPCALQISPPVLVCQVDVTSLPPLRGEAAAAFYRRLLELNASGLLHAAFAIEGDRVVLTSALELQNLDLNELEAVLSDLDLALAEQVPALRALAQQQGS